MERRKDTPGISTKLPPDYLTMISGVFNDNFKKSLMIEKGKKEKFFAYGEIYPDELLLCVSLNNPVNLRSITCYASVDFPPASTKTETEQQPTSSAQAVEVAVGQCVDAIASFFATFFDEDRPVDYEDQFKQNWAIIELDKATKVYVMINRSNPALEEQADAILEKEEAVKEAKIAKKKSKQNIH